MSLVAQVQSVSIFMVVVVSFLYTYCQMGCGIPVAPLQIMIAGLMSQATRDGPGTSCSIISRR